MRARWTRSAQRRRDVSDVVMLFAVLAAIPGWLLYQPGAILAALVLGAFAVACFPSVRRLALVIALGTIYLYWLGGVILLALALDALIRWVRSRTPRRHTTSPQVR